MPKPSRKCSLHSARAELAEVYPKLSKVVDHEVVINSAPTAALFGTTSLHRTHRADGAFSVHPKIFLNFIQDDPLLVSIRFLVT